MSKYYKVNDLKVRVSDHEPNFSMNKFRGENEIELYVKDACNNLLSIETQIEVICEKRGYNISDFQEILNEWKDGTYNAEVFAKRVEEIESNTSYDSLIDLRAKVQRENDEKLRGHNLGRFASRAEVKALSDEIGVSCSYIKKYFGIR